MINWNNSDMEECIQNQWIIQLSLAMSALCWYINAGCIMGVDSTFFLQYIPSLFNEKNSRYHNRLENTYGWDKENTHRYKVDGQQGCT